MGTPSRFFSQMEGPQGAASYPGASWDFRQVVAAQRSRESFKNGEKQGKAQREFFHHSHDPMLRDFSRKSREAPGYEAAKDALFWKVSYRS